MPTPPEDAVVADLRATLLSSKTPLRIQDVNTDYRVINGSHIPFREFGHKSLEEFLTKLKDKGEITMKYEGGNLLVHAIAKASSAHVLNLISKQKPSKKRGGSSSRGRGGRSGRGGGGYGRSSGFGRPSAYVPPSRPSSQSYRSSSNYSSFKGAKSGSYGGNSTSSYQSYNGTQSGSYGGSNAQSHQSYNGTQSGSYGGSNASSYQSNIGTQSGSYGGSKASSYQSNSGPQSGSYGGSNGSSYQSNSGPQSGSYGGSNGSSYQSNSGPQSGSYGGSNGSSYQTNSGTQSGSYGGSNASRETNLPEKSVNSRLSSRQNSTNSKPSQEFWKLPARLQNRLGPKVFNDHDDRHAHSYADNEWEDRVVTIESSPEIDKSVGKVSNRLNSFRSANAQSLQSETIAPRFQKKLDERLNQNSSSSLSTSSSSPDIINKSPDFPNNQSEATDQPVVKTSRRPGDYLEKAREKARAQKLAEEQAPPSSSSASLSSNSQFRNNGFMSNPMLQNQSYQNQSLSHLNLGIQSLPGFNIMQNQFNPYNLTPMSLTAFNVMPPLLTHSLPPQSLPPQSLPPQSLPPLISVNPNSPSFIPLSQSSPKYPPPVNTSLPTNKPLNLVTLNSGSDGSSGPSSLPSSISPYSNNSSSASSSVTLVAEPSNLSKPVSGLSMRSATPAQDRLKRLHQPLNPDPKIPLPSSLSQVPENVAEMPANNMHNLVHSLNTFAIDDVKISEFEKSLVNSESDSSSVSFSEKLSQLAAKLNLPSPVYKSIPRYCKTERMKLFACTITLDPDKKYCSFPQEFKTPEEAEEAAAKAAYADLTKKLFPPSQRLRPHTTASPFVLASRITHLIGGRSNGIWSDEIPSMYEGTYMERLSEDWLQLISESKELDVVHVGSRAIISPATSTKIPAPPPLIPPESPHWSVFVTVAKSTAEVWVRLIGEDYSEKCADLSDEMALSLAEINLEDHVVSPEVGYYYTVKDGELWHRVKLLSMKDDSCECHLIDVGETDTFSVNQIFSLDPMFLDLPAQAIKCTLHNLEKYADDPQSQAYLNVIEGNVFVAEVKSKKEPYSIELYDTSSEDNIHMGEELLQKFDAENSAPLLPAVGSIQRGDIKTYISHVSDTGEIFLQFHTNHFKIVQELIDSITPEDEALNTVTKLSDISSERPYLARYSDEEWYRATITNINSENDIEVYFLDYGNSHSVSMNELLSLEKLPNFLSLILPQAILVHLDMLPPTVFSDKMAEKIRELVPEDEEVLVKKVREEDIPIVELFIRIPPTNVLASVNNTILMDPELAKLIKEREQNPSVSAKDDGDKCVDSNSSSRKQSSDSQTSESAANTNLKVDAKPFVPKSFAEPTKVVPQAIVAPKPNTSFNEKKAPSKASSDIDTINPFELKPFKVPESENGLFTVFVVNVASPHNFVIQTESSKTQLAKLENEMSKFYDKYGSSAKKVNIEVGKTFAVKNDAGLWQRFTVTQVTPEFCIGGFPDTGGFKMYPAEDIYALMPTYRDSYQVLATKARLADVRPKSFDWDLADIVVFRSMVENKNLKCRVVGKGKTLELELFEGGPGNESNIAEQLVKRNCAGRTKEWGFHKCRKIPKGIPLNPIYEP